MVNTSSYAQPVLRWYIQANLYITSDPQYQQNSRILAGSLKTCLNPPRGRGGKRIGTLASEDECIRFVKKQFFFCCKQRGRGGGLDYVPFWAPGQFDCTKLAHCTSRPCIIQNKTTIRPLRHILRKENWQGPQGVQTGPNWHIAHLDHASYKIRLQ